MSNSKQFNLIVPAAADNGTANSMPSVFRFDKDGVMLCIKAIMGLNIDSFTRIVFTVLRKHVQAFDVDLILRLQLKRIGLERAEICILEHPTSSQPETVALTIDKMSINGSIFIKDADSYFIADIYPENGIAVFPLESLEVVDPRNKSYVSVDDMQYVTNIIEKKVRSNLFSAGGYAFSDSKIFTNIFLSLHHFHHIYLSHLIYALLLEGETFRPIYVENYIDYSLSID